MLREVTRHILKRLNFTRLLGGSSAKERTIKGKAGSSIRELRNNTLYGTTKRTEVRILKSVRDKGLLGGFLNYRNGMCDERKSENRTRRGDEEENDASDGGVVE